MSDYWWGFFTVPVLFAIGYGLIWLIANALWELGQHGWFFEKGGAEADYIPPAWHATRRVHSFLCFHWIVYGTNEYGSRSLTIGARDEGRGVAVGYKDVRFARTKKENA